MDWLSQGMTLRDALSQSQNGYGKRLDGTRKGRGYYGELLGNEGRTSTELSFDFDSGGKNIFAPLLVPGLTMHEINHLLSGQKPTNEIYDKASQHAIRRIQMGKSPFASPMDVIPLPPR